MARDTIDPREDARRLERWIAGLGPAISTLEEGAGITLDLSRESLVPLWEWAVTRMGPPDRATADPGNPPALPEWARLPGHAQAWTVYSSQTLWLVDRLARYHAECLVRAVPEFGWAVFEDRREVTLEDGEICLVLGRPDRRGLYPMNVFLVRDLLVQATRVVSYGRRTATALRELHDIRRREAAGVLSSLRR